MKFIKVIFLLILILKSTTGFSIDISMMICDTECTQISAQEQSDTDEKDDCCNGSLCDCMCCGHIFVSATNKIQLQELQETFIKTQFSSTGIYLFSLPNIIWHPPKMNQ